MFSAARMRRFQATGITAMPGLASTRDCSRRCVQASGHDRPQMAGETAQTPGHRYGAGAERDHQTASENT
jgi:hypothetical protein